MRCGFVSLVTGSIVVATLQMASAYAQHDVSARKMEHDKGQEQWSEWKTYPVRTIADLHVSLKNIPEDQYGGRTDRSGRKTGFYHTEQVAGRWWVVDPAGHLYLQNGIATVSQGASPKSKAALLKRYGTAESWMNETQKLLLENGNNGVGAWSDDKRLRNSSLQKEHPLSYAVNLDVMRSYGLKRGGTYDVPGHKAYPEDTIFAFDPEFPAFADEYLKRIDANRDDPNLMGYFSDNEIPLWLKNLDGFLRLPKTDPGHLAAERWMAERHATVITDALRSAFLEFEADHYFKIISDAIRKHDPNHMYLGCRYTAQQLKVPELFRALGKYAGAVSINYYSDWTPSKEMMEMWVAAAGKPFVITEFYVKGEDSGMPNRTGAGWEVRTQRDRGLFYQNFVLALIQSRGCIGWHWFKYQDNDPTDPHAELSNVDSNKGILNVEYEPYQPLLSSMRELNRTMYSVADYFDAPPHGRQ